MRNLDETIIKYYEITMKLYSRIDELSKGDLRTTSVVLIINNDEEAQKLYQEMESVLEDFEREISTTSMYTTSESLMPMLESIEGFDKRGFSSDLIKDLLKDIQDEWESIEAFVPRGNETLKALEYLPKLPNFDPDVWLRRNFLIEGIYIPSNVFEVPINVTRGYQESYACFIYGFYSATCAMSRAVLEFILKDRFPRLKENKLSVIISNWDKISELKPHHDKKQKVELIRRAGNQSLHGKNKKLRLMINEMMAQRVLNNLKTLIEFFYSEK